MGRRAPRRQSPPRRDVPPPLGFEWEGRKAAINDRKHGVTFVEAASAFADERSLDVRDEAHSTPQDDRWIMVATSSRRRLLTVSYAEVVMTSGSSARETPSLVRGEAMKRARKKPLTDPGDEAEMQPSYDMKGGVRGKHAKRYAAGIKVILDPDVGREFPTSEMVNDALRLLMQLRNPGLRPERRS